MQKKLAFLVLVFIFLNVLASFAIEKEIVKSVVNKTYCAEASVISVNMGPEIPSSADVMKKIKLKNKAFYLAQYRVIFKAAESNAVILIELIGFEEEAYRVIVDSRVLNLDYGFHIDEIELLKWIDYNTFILKTKGWHTAKDKNTITVKIVDLGKFEIEYNLK